MSIPAAWLQILDFFGTPLVIEPSAGQLSGDAGLLPIRQFDQSIGLIWAFADALDDRRDPDLTEHTFIRGRSPLHLANAADQGSGGSHRQHAADRGTTVIELAAPGLVSAGVRALAQYLPTPGPDPSG